MARRTTERIVRGVTEPLWRRDLFEMRAVDALVSRLAPGQRSSERSAAKPANSSKQETTMIETRKWAGFRSVLCPIDFSEHSRHALEYAAAVALNAKAGLHVVYVGDPLLVAAAAAALRNRQLDEQTARELQAFIDATLPPRTQRRVRLTALVSAGNPADQILKAAARQRSDLIVVGSHGANAAKRLLVGSTTLDLLQRSTVPVLAIPRRARGPSRAQPR